MDTCIEDLDDRRQSKSGLRLDPNPDYVLYLPHASSILGLYTGENFTKVHRVCLFL